MGSTTPSTSSSPPRPVKKENEEEIKVSWEIFRKPCFSTLVLISARNYVSPLCYWQPACFISSRNRTRRVVFLNSIRSVRDSSGEGASIKVRIAGLRINYQVYGYNINYIRDIQ